MANEIRNELNNRLADAFLSLKDRDECYAFFEDLLTRRELDDMAQRLEVARLLKQNVTYSDITRDTGASSATIGRVNRALTYGTGGYAEILDRISEDD